MSNNRFLDFIEDNMAACLTVIAMIFFLILCGMAGSYSNSDTMKERADAKARCDSLGGSFGDMKCFVNGEEK